MARRKHLPNKVIFGMKLLSGLGFFFACCLFFFIQLEDFKQDLGFNSALPLGSAANPWYNVLFPIGFFLGVGFIIYYITNMVIRFETKELWRADRLYIAYQVVFMGIEVIMIWRWVLISLTNALLPSIILVVSGFINLVTPKIVDNDNLDF